MIHNLSFLGAISAILFSFSVTAVGQGIESECFTVNSASSDVSNRAMEQLLTSDEICVANTPNSRVGKYIRALTNGALWVLDSSWQH